MISPRSIWHATLQQVLSWTASLNAQATGSGYQSLLLQAMGVHVSGPVAIGPGTTFLGCANLRLGRYVTIGANSRIVSWAGITIGDDFMASDQLTLNSGGHDPQTLAPQLAPITIGHRVWCGTGVIICAGVEIGDDVVIGAGSIVTRSLPSNCIAYGSPAKPVRALDRDNTAALWSMWPERSGYSEWEKRGRARQWAHWLRARI
jgi:acetyltransferase-like isoleucine patch superfamily enzyme